MFKNSTTVLRIFDIQINLAASWFLIAALIAWSLADQVFPAEVPGLAPALYLLLGAAGMVLFFASLLAHELAHALVARHFGLEVPRITLFLFGGVAELGDEPDTAQHEFWIAIAGPVMSLLLAGGFWVLAALWSGVGAGLAGNVVLSYLGSINLILAIFNMLPAFPLDGGRVLRAVLWSRSGEVWTATETATRLGEFLGLALMALGVLALFQGAQLGGAWQILIGLFIVFAARGAMESLRSKTLLDDRTVASVMTRDVLTADPDLTLADLVNGIMLPGRVSFVPVVENGTLIGHIDAAVLGMIDRENWSTTQVGDVYVGLDSVRTIEARALATDALRRITETGERKLLVLEDRELVGIVTLSDLVRQLQLLISLNLRPETAA